MKNLILLIALCFVSNVAFAQLNSREKADTFLPTVNQNSLFYASTKWEFGPAIPDGPVCEYTTSEIRGLQFTCIDTDATLKVTQRITFAELRKHRVQGRIANIGFKTDAFESARVTAYFYSSTSGGALTVLGSKTYNHNNINASTPRTDYFEVNLDSVPSNGSVVMELIIDKPSANIAFGYINAFQMRGSVLEESIVAINTNQTQSETLLNVGNLTQTTDLSTFTKENQTGSGIYTLSSAGITFLRDANVSITSAIYNNTVDTQLRSSIYLDGIYLSGDSVVTSTFADRSSTSFNGIVTRGSRITFFNVGTGGTPRNTNIQILATVSVPAVATNKYREPVTKYLSSNITSDTLDIADFKFTDLVVGDRYSFTACPQFVTPSPGVGNNELVSSQGDIYLNARSSSSAAGTAGGSRCGTFEFVASSPTLSFSYTRSTSNLLGTGSSTGSWVSLKRIDSVMQAYLLESNIEKDVEQFHTDERKICDRCYKGKALYKKCFSGVLSATNTANFATGVTGIARIDGYMTYTTIPDRRISPSSYMDNTTWQMWRVSSGVLYSECTGTACSSADQCVEYTKD